MSGMKAHPPNEWKQYIGPFYWLNDIEGDWDLDGDYLYTLEKVIPMKLKDFFEFHKDWYAKF